MKTSHFIIDQLLHFSLLNTKPKTFSIFNAGIPNAFYVVAGCYNKVFAEDGKPFLFCCITKTPKYYSNFFGKLYTYQLDDGNYFIISNWRRLNTAKLTHMKDAYYMVLSTVMNSILSLSSVESYTIPDKYLYIYSLRCIISLCTNQKVSELLMDNRYAYMSSFSIYTNINKLLIEKFSPPYHSILESWIIDRLLTNLPKIHEAVLSGSIKFVVPEFQHGIRQHNSIGGDIMIPSLWGDYFLNDVQEVMDEAFIYVLTMKEPSNVFHEEVNAIKTIIEFQTKYDNLPDQIKHGSFHRFNDIYDYLLYDTKIGFCAPIIYNSTKYTLSREKPNIRKFVHQINNEPISELISTKAVISDLDRELTIEETKKTRRQINKFVDKIIKYKKSKNEETNEKELENFKTTYLKTHTRYYNERKPRQKVIETILDFLEADETKDIDRTIKLAEYFVLKQNGKMIADICIKSQYGSKREFYVINIGAKSLARVCENFFKKISENSPNEAISIPGDEKTLAMQKMLDRIYNQMPHENYKLMYVNGDCTKWSAAETLGSFLAMGYAFKDILPENMYNTLIATFNVWSDKYIQIPLNVYNKVVVPNDEVINNYKINETIKKLNDSFVKTSGLIHSTQNFLQGMFNYTSSYKAVCCTNYTYYLWKKIYPLSKLLLEHLEHSDDYVLVVFIKEYEEFEKFRAFHKMMMRLCGYNDSDRKTNCQYVFMEFVSQMSFNGVMIYPQIKKSKEVNVNLPCIGYKQDMDAALSRVGECMRVGCNQTFLYFFEKLHVKCVAEAYSLLPGMYNSKNKTYEELFNKPVEMFGLPEILPLFSLYCRGNVNNYRLFNHSTTETRLLIIMLYELGIENKEKEDIMYEDNEYSYSLFTPKFLYEINNKSMIKLRRTLNITYEELKDFWLKHISYRLIKPNNKENLKFWIKAMFFNRTFIEAYTKSSRTKMTMRLSN